jgi:hypothetical protein
VTDAGTDCVPSPHSRKERGEGRKKRQRSNLILRDGAF